MTYPRTGNFTVPRGVYRLEVHIWGAGGGAGRISPTFPRSYGGGGAYVGGLIDVNPDDSFLIIVGQGGTRGSPVDTSFPPQTGAGGVVRTQAGGPAIDPNLFDAGNGGGFSGIFRRNPICVQSLSPSNMPTSTKTKATTATMTRSRRPRSDFPSFRSLQEQEQSSEQCQPWLIVAIAAGGGGGGCFGTPGGAGGIEQGFTGGLNPRASNDTVRYELVGFNATFQGGGGTQSSGGASGIPGGSGEYLFGGSGVSNRYQNGGGGGGFYGGGAGYAGGGGGGSSFVSSAFIRSVGHPGNGTSPGFIGPPYTLLPGGVGFGGRGEPYEYKAGGAGYVMIYLT